MSTRARQTTSPTSKPQAVGRFPLREPSTYTDALHGTGTLSISATDTSDEDASHHYNTLTDYAATFADNNGKITSSINTSSVNINETGTLDTSNQGSFTITGHGSGTAIYPYNSQNYTLTVSGNSSGTVTTHAPDLSIISASWLADGGVEFTFANSGLIATTNRANGRFQCQTLLGDRNHRQHHYLQRLIRVGCDLLESSNRQGSTVLRRLRFG